MRKPWSPSWRIPVLLAAVALSVLRAQDAPPSPPPSPRTVEDITECEPAARLEADVRQLVSDFHPRDRVHPENLDRVAAHLKARMETAGGRTTEQVFQSEGRTYRNILARFGPDTGDLLVIGAHYDAVSSRPGADDNASGVAGLLELARRFGASPPVFPVLLAAYTLEESGLLGSEAHAQSLAAGSARVRAMISLEMIGCFKDDPASQRYPISLLKLFYPGRGNFIVVAGKTGDGGLARKLKRVMAKATPLPVRAFVAPRTWIPDLGRSDHASFWKVGIPAVMVTDTANLRNVAYHTNQDVPESLDYVRMALTVRGLEVAIRAQE